MPHAIHQPSPAIDDTLLVLLRDGGLVAIRAGRQRYLDAAAARVAAAGRGCEATSLCQDGRGNVWVTLADGSVGRFSGVTADEGPEAGAGPTVTWFERVFGEAAKGEAEVFADEQGTVWLAGGGGLFALAPDDRGLTKRAAIPASAVRFARRRVDDDSRGACAQTRTSRPRRYSRSRRHDHRAAGHRRTTGRSGGDDGPFPDTVGGFLPVVSSDQRGRRWRSSHERLVVCDPTALELAPPPASPLVEQVSVDGKLVSGGPGCGAAWWRRWRPGDSGKW